MIAPLPSASLPRDFAAARWCGANRSIDARPRHFGHRAIEAASFAREGRVVPLSFAQTGARRLESHRVAGGSKWQRLDVSTTCSFPVSSRLAMLPAPVPSRRRCWRPCDEVALRASARRNESLHLIVLEVQAGVVVASVPGFTRPNHHSMVRRDAVPRRRNVASDCFQESEALYNRQLFRTRVGGNFLEPAQGSRAGAPRRCRGPCFLSTASIPVPSRSPAGQRVAARRDDTSIDREHLFPAGIWR